MFRALTFFFFLIVTVFGQTQQVNSNLLPYLPFGTQNLQNSSVADQIPRTNQAAPSTNSYTFFGTSDPSTAFIVNDRWNMVGTYSLLFFSFVLNVFLVFKLKNYRRRKVRMTWSDFNFSSSQRSILSSSLLSNSFFAVKWIIGMVLVIFVSIESWINWLYSCSCESRIAPNNRLIQSLIFILYILSGTFTPSKPMESAITLATFSLKSSLIARNSVFSSLRILTLW